MFVAKPGGAAIALHGRPASDMPGTGARLFLSDIEHNALDPRWLKSDESWCAGTSLIAQRKHHMPTYSIDSDNNLAVHPDKDATIKEAGVTGATFTTETELSEAAA